MGNDSMKSQRPASLPDFERPPLDEMVLSIQFADLPLKNVHAGLLWPRLRDQYPNVQEQAPVPPVFETYGALRAATSNAAEIRLLAPDAMIRYWFIAPDECQLLQFQQDRIIHNWRSRRTEDAYPRYEPLRERFESEIVIIQDFLRENNLGEIKCNQCEVSYLNAIGSLNDGQDPNLEIDKIFTVWCERFGGDGYLAHSERSRFSASFLLREGPSTDPWGRLHVMVSPGIRKIDSAPVVRLHITARGKPHDESVGAALEWLDRGRVAVVRSFVSITTETMHKVWGRKDVR